MPETAWRGERSRTLLQYLATRPQGRTTRDELIDALWSHLPPEQAKGSLHVTVNRLRRALASVAPDLPGDQLVTATASGYQLATGTWVDVMALSRLVEEVRGLQSHDSAAALQRLAEMDWPQMPELQVDQPYSDWATAVRERVRREYVSLQILRADLLNAAGRSDQALEALVRLLESEPVLESVARQAMLIAYKLGNQILALSIFDRCRRALAEELGVTPLPETLSLHAQILAQPETNGTSMALALQQPSPSVQGPAPTSSDTRRGNLPVLLSSCIGRRSELGRLAQLLRSSRLVTITGLGGAGKTRLALQAATLIDPPGGVWFVDLSRLSVPSHVGVAVLESLGLHDQDQEPPVSRLATFLQSKQLLLILDNCEHLIEACSALPRWPLSRTALGTGDAGRRFARLQSGRLGGGDPAWYPSARPSAADG